MTLPLVGAIPLNGLTAEQAETAIASTLRAKELIKDPEVQTWLIENSGMARKLIEPVIESLSR